MSGHVDRWAPALAGLLAGAWVWWGTPWGLGLSPDSLAYLSAARGVSEAGDLSRLPIAWPPLYPLAIAAITPLTSGAAEAARLLAALLAALNAILMFSLQRRCGLAAPLAGLLAALFALHPHVLKAHLTLASEPLFLALMLANVWALLGLSRAEPRPGRIAIAALFAGLATVARYAGIWLVAASVLGAALGLRQRGGWAMLRSAGLAAAIGIAPLLAWSLFNIVRGTGVAYREFALHFPEAWQWTQAEATLAGWAGVPGAAGWAVLAGTLLLAVLPWYSRGEAPGRGVARLAGALGAGYLAFVLLSITLADAHIPLDDRILLPLLACVWLLIGHAIARATAHGRRTGIVGLALVAMLAWAAQSGTTLWSTSRAEGIGLASRRVAGLPVLEQLRKLPRDWRFATNGREIFLLHLEQRGQSLPAKFDARSRKANPRFDGQMADMAHEVDGIVVFGVMRYRRYLPDIPEVSALPGFVPIYAGPDAVVWLRRERVRAPE